jgi:hypothetical protein
MRVLLLLTALGLAGCADTNSGHEQPSRDLLFVRHIVIVA